MMHGCSANERSSDLCPELDAIQRSVLHLRNFITDGPHTSWHDDVRRATIAAGLRVTQDWIDFPRNIDTHDYDWLQRLNFQA